MKVFELVKKKHIKSTKTKAKKLGLDVLDFTAIYTLSKLSAKNPNAYGYLLPMSGRVELVGDEKSVWIALFGNLGEWFKTSPIVKTEFKDGGLIIETKNSFYKLTKKETLNDQSNKV